MRFYKYFLIFIVILPLLSFNSEHKFYLSVTEVEHVEEKKSIQIITRIFIDDLERLIHERYDDSVILDKEEESNKVNIYIERYLKERIKVKIDNIEAELNFIGKEYEYDILYCYLEIENINISNSFQISNEVLFDMFNDQQNIVKLKMNGKYKSFLLNTSNRSVELKFD